MAVRIDQKNDSDLLAPCEAARLFGVGQRAVARWAGSGLLPPITTPGGHRRFRVADVRRLLHDGAPRRRGLQCTRSVSGGRYRRGLTYWAEGRRVFGVAAAGFENKVGFICAVADLLRGVSRPTSTGSGRAPVHGAAPVGVRPGAHKGQGGRIYAGTRGEGGGRRADPRARMLADRAHARDRGAWEASRPARRRSATRRIPGSAVCPEQWPSRDGTIHADSAREAITKACCERPATVLQDTPQGWMVRNSVMEDSRRDAE